MKTIANIIRKDIRQNRMVLLGWVILVLAHFGIRCAQISDPFDTAGGFWPSLFRSSSGPDLALLLVLPVLFVPLVMLADPMEKRLAFWKSLPVARGSLIAAKALLVCAVFVVFPLLMETAYFILAGMRTVLADSLKLWLLLHLPLLAMIFLLCYVTPGWKSYLTLVVVVAGCALPCVGWSVRQLIVAGALRQLGKWSQAELQAVDLPEGASWQVLPESVDSVAESLVEGTGSTKTTTEVVGGGFTIDIAGLPRELVICGSSIGGAEWTLDNGHRVGISPVYLSVGYCPRPGGNSHSTSSGGVSLRTDTTMGLADPLGPIPSENHEQLRVTWDRVPCAFADLPATGGTLKGVFKLTLAKEHILKEWPLGDFDWQDGVRGMRVRVEGIRNPIDGIIPFRIRTGFHRPLTELGPGTTEIDHRRFPECFLWLENRSHPLGKVLDRLTVDRQSDFARTEVVWTDLSRNAAIGWNRHEFLLQWLREENFGRNAWDLPLREVCESGSPSENWRLALKGYEPYGVVAMPFEIRLPKPYRLQAKERNANYVRTTAIKRAAFAADLAAIRLPDKPTEREAEEAFYRLSALAGLASEGDPLGNSREKLVEDHKVEIDRLLRRIYQASPRSLVEGQWRVAVDRRRPGSIGGGMYWGSDGLSGVFDTLRMHDSANDKSGYWFYVNKVVETESSLADKDLILAHLHPRLDQVPTLERHGWLDEALPLMCRIAARETVSVSWFRVLKAHRSDQTKRVLLEQIRTRSLPFGCLMELLSSGWPEADCREFAEANWQAAFRWSSHAEEVRGAFAVALKYGVADAPRQVKRVIRYEIEMLERERVDPDPTLTAHRSLIQTMALWSDCPEDPEKGSQWILDHGDELVWNPDRCRYEIPGTVSEGKPTRMPEEIAGWGKWSDPLGVSRLTQSGDEVVIRSSALPTDYNEGMVYNFSPRILREVTGDFTVEVTVAPRFTPSASWTLSEGGSFQAGGLLVEASPWDWVRNDNLMFGDEGVRRVGESVIRGLRPVFEWSDPPAFDPARPVTLQIRRHGDLFVSSWRQGSGDWHEFTGRRIHQWPKTVKVGVLTINKNMLPLEVVFSGFKLLSTAEPPARMDAQQHSNPPERTTRDGDDLGIFGKAGNVSGAGVFDLRDRRLTIATQPHTSDFNPTHWDTAPRALNEVKGDFSFEVTIDPPGQANGWISPNLMIADAGKRIYFRAGPTFDGGRAIFNAFLKVDTQYSYIPWMGGPFDFTRPVRVRVERHGVVFRVAAKGEGGDWLRYAPFIVPRCPEALKVGVVSLNVSDQPVVAGFEDPELRIDDGKSGSVGDKR